MAQMDRSLTAKSLRAFKMAHPAGSVGKVGVTAIVAVRFSLLGYREQDRMCNVPFMRDFEQGSMEGGA